MASVRPFGVFVRSRTLPRDGLVHASQIDDQIELSKDDPDDAKIQALTWAAQPGSQVRVGLGLSDQICLYVYHVRVAATNAGRGETEPCLREL